MKYRYRYTLKRDTNNTWLVTFPDVPGAITYGETKAEAHVRARDALASMLEAYRQDGQPFPKATPPRKGQRTVRYKG